MAHEARDDLAAMFAQVLRHLTAAEEPLLTEHGLTMWEYVVLSRLARGPAPNQLTLAREIRHDKTRLIKLLDGLEVRRLIDRRPDPADRRSHTVLITDAGLALQSDTQAAIREMEAGVLQALTQTERRALLSAVPKLAARG